MNQNLATNSEALIHNPEFYEWVIRPTKESDQHWKQFISENSGHETEVGNAIFFIQSIIPKEKELTEEVVLNLWNRIENDTITPRKRIFRISTWMTAASFLLLVGITGLLYFQLNKQNESQIDYQSIAKVKSLDSEVKLIFADKSEEVLPSDDLDIKYNSKGEIEVNSDKRLAKKNLNQDNGTEQLNQLVVPLGKRTSLTLSDGTRLWLNSGSRAIFPVVFTKQKREIFIEGEAYLEVAHDAFKPFFVVTDNVHLRVLGTTFNVSAYPDDQSTSVVLVEGSVEATVDSKKVLMKPNQLLTYEKRSAATALNTTDVLPYISWKDGWLYCEKETLETIATKLSRYYNVRIEFKDAETREMSLTGKLDLKTECSEIFKAISSTFPISTDVKDDVIVISQKSIN